MKCLNCKTGKLEVSGSHKYCDKCNHVEFVLTSDYVDACVVVLSELVSNTKFEDRKALGRTLLQHISDHLPMLERVLGTMIQGRAEFMASMMETVEDQAINLVLGGETLNEEEAEKTLTCRCGCEKFVINGPFELSCEDCGAPFFYNEDRGIYLPLFKCDCGSIRVAIDGSLGTCKECNAGYLYNKRERKFTPL